MYLHKSIRSIRECSIAMFVALSAVGAFAEDPDTPSQLVLSSHDRAFFETLARKIEPDLQGDSSRLAQYVRFYQQELANDVRLFAFRVMAQLEPDNARCIRLSGYTEFPEHRVSVAKLLQVLGFEIAANDIRMLPDKQLGELRFGLVTASRSLSYDQPSSPRAVVTECLVGEPLCLLKRLNDHYLCHCGEGYLGYIAAKDIRPVDEAEFVSYLAGDRVVVRTAHTMGDLFLPAGAQLKLSGRKPDKIPTQLPDGTVLALSPGQVAVQPASNPTVEGVIAAAEEFLGTPYFWGGKTNHGIDCSGLVQIAFGTAGFQLPRDSNQQVFLGRLTGTRWCTATMRRGDTMYFLGPRGRIRHTAIYLGENQFLQAAMPVVTISSLDPSHPAYDAKRHASFAFAKRLTD